MIVTMRSRSLIAYLFMTALLLSAASAADFGIAHWGDSIGEVRDKETLPNLTPLAATDYLIYAASLPGIQRARLIYEFENGRLHQGRFLFWPSEGATVATWIKQFDHVQHVLSRQYQSPEQRLILSPIGISQPSPAHWAEALQADQLILKNHWRFESTQIIQQLAWRERSPHHQAIFQPLAH